MQPRNKIEIWEGEVSFSKRGVQNFLALALVATALPRVALATEGGRTIWPIGINTVLPGINPAPGQNMFYNYTAWYGSTRLNNGQGDSAVPGVDIDVFATAARILHTWDYTSGPFSFTSGIAGTFTSSSVDLGPLGSGSATGLQSILLEPLYLNYISPDKTLFVNAGLLLNVPTGAYDPDRLVNVGANVWTMTPVVNLTYFFSPRLNVNLSISSDIRTKNTATGYSSGATFNGDYSVMFSPIESMPNLFIGPQGNWTTQLTDDTINGLVYNDGNRLEVLTIGPQVLYLIGQAGVALKWQHEVVAKNTTQGDKVWLQFAFPF